MPNSAKTTGSSLPDGPGWDGVDAQDNPGGGHGVELNETNSFFTLLHSWFLPAAPANSRNARLGRNWGPGTYRHHQYVGGGCTPVSGWTTPGTSIMGRASLPTAATLQAASASAARPASGPDTAAVADAGYAGTARDAAAADSRQGNAVMGLGRQQQQQLEKGEEQHGPAPQVHEALAPASIGPNLLGVSGVGGAAESTSAAASVEAAACGAARTSGRDVIATEPGTSAQSQIAVGTAANSDSPAIPDVMAVDGGAQQQPASEAAAGLPATSGVAHGDPAPSLPPPPLPPAEPAPSPHPAAAAPPLPPLPPLPAGLPQLPPVAAFHRSSECTGGSAASPLSGTAAAGTAGMHQAQPPRPQLPLADTPQHSCSPSPAAGSRPGNASGFAPFPSGGVIGGDGDIAAARLRFICDSVEGGPVVSGLAGARAKAAEAGAARRSLSGGGSSGGGGGSGGGFPGFGPAGWDVAVAARGSGTGMVGGGATAATHDWPYGGGGGGGDAASVDGDGASVAGSTTSIDSGVNPMAAAHAARLAFRSSHTLSASPSSSLPPAPAGAMAPPGAPQRATARATSSSGSANGAASGWPGGDASVQSSPMLLQPPSRVLLQHSQRPQPQSQPPPQQQQQQRQLGHQANSSSSSSSTALQSSLNVAKAGVVGGAQVALTSSSAASQGPGLLPMPSRGVAWGHSSLDAALLQPQQQYPHPQLLDPQQLQLQQVQQQQQTYLYERLSAATAAAAAATSLSDRALGHSAFASASSPPSLSSTFSPSRLPPAVGYAPSGTQSPASATQQAAGAFGPNLTLRCAACGTASMALTQARLQLEALAARHTQLWRQYERLGATAGATDARCTALEQTVQRQEAELQAVRTAAAAAAAATSALQTQERVLRELRAAVAANTAAASTPATASASPRPSIAGGAGHRAPSVPQSPIPGPSPRPSVNTGTGTGTRAIPAPGSAASSIENTLAAAAWRVAVAAPRHTSCGFGTPAVDGGRAGGDGGGAGTRLHTNPLPLLPDLGLGMNPALDSAREGRYSTDDSGSSAAGHAIDGLAAACVNGAGGAGGACSAGSGVEASRGGAGGAKGFGGGGGGGARVFGGKLTVGIGGSSVSGGAWQSQEQSGTMPTRKAGGSGGGTVAAAVASFDAATAAATSSPGLTSPTASSGRAAKPVLGVSPLTPRAVKSGAGMTPHDKPVAAAAAATSDEEDVRRRARVAAAFVRMQSNPLTEE